MHVSITKFTLDQYTTTRGFQCDDCGKQALSPIYWDYVLPEGWTQKFVYVNRTPFAKQYCPTCSVDHMSIHRALTPLELAELPSAWENSTVDTTRYYQTAVRAWEVDKQTYEKGKQEGSLAQQYKGKYYIGY